MVGSFRRSGTTLSMFFIYTRSPCSSSRFSSSAPWPPGRKTRCPWCVPEGAVVGVRGHGVGAGVLKGKSHVKAAAEALLQGGLDAVQKPLKKLAVTGQDGQVQPAPPIPVLDVGRGLHQLFLQGGAAGRAVVVKFDQGLGQVLVIKAGFGEDLRRISRYRRSASKSLQVVAVGRKDGLRLGIKGKLGETIVKNQELPGPVATLGQLTYPPRSSGPCPRGNNNGAGARTCGWRRRRPGQIW